MNGLKTILFALSVMSSSAMAAEEITPSEASKYEYIGNVSVSIDGFSMDNSALNKAVDDKGGKYYVITSEVGKAYPTIDARVYK